MHISPKNLVLNTSNFVQMENTPKPISKTTRFNILLMKRTNRLAIAMFVLGILYKTLDWLFLS